jgi:hypothetical protein
MKYVIDSSVMVKWVLAEPKQKAKQKGDIVDSLQRDSPS